ncbi:MAG: RNA chaperone Hfq [Acidobacteriota bacterium]|jgi:sRNA-binding regulator protein Hfq
MPDRKLIRPNLRDYKTVRREPREEKEEEPAPASGAFVPARRKQVPPEQTNAENFYYLKQMGSKTPMIIVLTDGEELRGWIEWYDRDCIKVHRLNEPNLLVYKHSIKYLFKEREA